MSFRIILTCWIAFVSSPVWAAGAADLILTNGHVYTDNPNSRWAEAVVVKDGKIAYVGSSADAKAKGGPKTKEIDLGGRLLLPGFIDPHDHVDDLVEAMFLANLGTTQFDPHTWSSYKKAILDFRASDPSMKVLRGAGMDPWILPAIAETKHVTPRELLDQVVPDIPVFIISWTGHQAWVNSKALELGGITKDTPNPVGNEDSEIGHDENGEPNGWLLETATFNLILDKWPVPDFSVEQYVTGIQAWQKDVAAPRGLTGLLIPTDFRTTNYFIALQQLSDQKKMTAHFSVAQWQDDTLGESQLPSLIATRARFHGGPYFRFNTVKVFAPWPAEKLAKTFAGLDKAGFQIYVHNVGDTASYNAVLDAFDYMLKQNGPRDSRHVISHVRPAAAPLAPRFKALGVRADSDRNAPPKAFYDVGVPSTISSDYNTRDPSPLKKIGEAMKNGGIPLEKLIDSATITAAELQFFDKLTGSITVGKAADLIVMDKDLFKITPEEIPTDKVLLTLFAGKELYRDASFQ